MGYIHKWEGYTNRPQVSHIEINSFHKIQRRLDNKNRLK